MFAEWPSRWTHALHIFRFLLLLLFGRAKPMWSKKSLEPSNPAYLQMMSFMDLQFSRAPEAILFDLMDLDESLARPSLGVSSYMLQG